MKELISKGKMELLALDAFTANNEAVGEAVITKMTKEVEWSDSLLKILPKVSPTTDWSDVTAENVVDAVRYMVVSQRVDDYIATRDNAWESYKKAEAAYQRAYDLVATASSRGYTATYTRGGKTYAWEDKLPELNEKTEKARARYFKVLIPECEAVLDGYEFNELDFSENPLAGRVFDLLGAVLFGYTKVYRHNELTALRTATAWAVAFGKLNAKAGGERNTDTAKAYTEMKQAFEKLFASFVDDSVKIHFNSEETLLLSSFFGKLDLTISKVVGTTKSDVQMTSESESACMNRILKLVVFKLEGHKTHANDIVWKK